MQPAPVAAGAFMGKCPRSPWSGRSDQATCSYVTVAVGHVVVQGNHRIPVTTFHLPGGHSGHGSPAVPHVVRAVRAPGKWSCSRLPKCE
jgi:hypothetical protein